MAARASRCVQVSQCPNTGLHSASLNTAIGTHIRHSVTTALLSIAISLLASARRYRASPLAAGRVSLTCLRTADWLWAGYVATMPNGFRSRTVCHRCWLRAGLPIHPLKVSHVVRNRCGANRHRATSYQLRCQPVRLSTELVAPPPRRRREVAITRRRALPRRPYSDEVPPGLAYHSVTGSDKALPSAKWLRAP